MDKQIELNVTSSAKATMCRLCALSYKVLNYGVTMAEIIPVKSSNRFTKTGSDSCLMSLLDLTMHLCCCSEDLQT